MERIKIPVDESVYKEIFFKNISQNDRANLKNVPTHFSLEPMSNGYDKVRYFILRD